jgi:ornithine cyclodeaminase
MMRSIDAPEVERALDYPSLIDRLREAFRGGVEAPRRHHHTIPDRDQATLLLMPAWQKDGPLGVKIATVFPSNQERGLPSVFGVYLLLDGMTGEPVAAIEARSLTRRRTAAASALAAGYLAREDAARLVMVGTGALAPELIEAHGTVRTLQEVVIWGRTPAKAERLARRLDRPERRVRATGDLETAVAEADIVACATLSSEPLVQGAWLSPGCHLDLVGAFKPTMREADDEALRRARIFVDTREGALGEAGHIVDPMARGVIGESDIEGDLYGLCRGETAGRREANEITLFKSTGAALEDLAAATLVVERS